jgi:hypothetical protein
LGFCGAGVVGGPASTGHNTGLKLRMNFRLHRR